VQFLSTAAPKRGRERNPYLQLAVGSRLFELQGGSSGDMMNEGKAPLIEPVHDLAVRVLRTGEWEAEMEYSTHKVQLGALAG